MSKGGTGFKKGQKVPFKQIAIHDEEDDSQEEDYIPPKTFDLYSDESQEASGDEDEASGDEDTENQEDALERIKSNLPKESNLSRKRKIKVTQGVNKRRKIKVTKSILKKTAEDRVREFPDNFLSVRNGLLHCRACNLPDISLKKSTIKSHLQGETHKKNVTRRDRSQLTLLDYKRIIVVNESEDATAGSTLPLDVNAYRMTVAHALLKSGTPFSILDADSEFRQLLEDGHSSCPKQACSDLIPSLNKKEHLLTLEELNGATSFSISTDGTINVAEALAMVRNTFKIAMHTTLLFYLSHCSIIIDISYFSGR